MTLTDRHAMIAQATADRDALLICAAERMNAGHFYADVLGQARSLEQQIDTLRHAK